MSKRDVDILYFGSTTWQLIQRPQNIALELNKRGYRVFYVEPMLSVGGLFLGASPLKQSRTSGNVSVLKPFLSFSTFRFGVSRKLDKQIFYLWFLYMKRKHDLRQKKLVFINLPYWWKNILTRELLGDCIIIYDCVDDCRIHSRTGRILEKMEKSERDFASDADVCFTTADDLFNKIKEYNQATFMLPNAVDTEFFMHNGKRFPEDLRLMEKPLIGFVGSLYDHIDFHVFEKIAAGLKQGTLVLVGMTNRQGELSRLVERFGNIVYLGAKDYSDVPSYINAFDICLSPFTMDTVGNSVNPLKLYEYLIFGKPVISSATNEMKKYREYVYLYRSYDELEPVLLKAIDESKNEIKRQERINFAQNNSWGARVDLIEKICRIENL